MTKLPLGSNLACPNHLPGGGLRVRRDWEAWGDYGRALFLDAVETAIERGLHQRFAAYHADHASDVQAHETCAFLLWHRRFILAYENMLRSLEPRFACLGLPFWNIARDYRRQEDTMEPCRSYATCAGIVNDIGGIVANDDFHDRTYNGYHVDGHWHFQSPVQNLRDDNDQVGIIRYDLWLDPIPRSAGNWIAPFANGGSDLLAFSRALQVGLHDDVHDTIGGFMRTPTSPIDPIFFAWHSTIDLLLYLWEICNYDVDGQRTTQSTGLDEQCLYSADAKNLFPTFNLSSSDIYIRRGDLGVDRDPLIGAFFHEGDLGFDFAKIASVRELSDHDRFVYADIPIDLKEGLASNAFLCPRGLTALELDEHDILKGQQTPNQQNMTTFSVDEIRALVIPIWMAEANNFWTNLYPNEPDMVGHHKQYADCLLSVMDNDTLERWAIDDIFLREVVRAWDTTLIRHPKCDHLLVVNALSNATKNLSTISPTMEISSAQVMLTPRHSLCILAAVVVLKVLTA